MTQRTQSMDWGAMGDGERMGSMHFLLSQSEFNTLRLSQRMKLDKVSWRFYR